jgi:hypothetical protein
MGELPSDQCEWRWQSPRRAAREILQGAVPDPAPDLVVTHLDDDLTGPQEGPDLGRRRQRAVEEVGHAVEGVAGRHRGVECEGGAAVVHRHHRRA